MKKTNVSQVFDIGGPDVLLYHLTFQVIHSKQAKTLILTKIHFYTKQLTLF